MFMVVSFEDFDKFTLMLKYSFINSSLREWSKGVTSSYSSLFCFK